MGNSVVNSWPFLWKGDPLVITGDRYHNGSEVIWGIGHSFFALDAVLIMAGIRTFSRSELIARV